MAGRYRGPINTASPIPDGEARISIYGYTPALALAITALVTFGIAFIAHAVHFFRSRKALGGAAPKQRGTRVFQFLLCFGCAMEIVGYGSRTVSTQNTFIVIAFILNYFFIVTAPVFFTAALYLSLSIAARRRNATSILPIRPRLLVIIFVVIDVVTTALQVLGAAFIGVSESARADGETPFITTKAANDILLAGLAVQNASFLVFLILLAVVAIRNRKLKPAHTHTDVMEEKKGEHTNGAVMANDPTLVHHDSEDGIVASSTDNSEQQYRLPPLFLVVLGTTSLLIWLRTLFRLAETAEGVFGFASTNEALFGCLEYTPVIIALAIWAALPLHKLLKMR